MKYIVFFLTVFFFSSFGQTLREMTPELGYLVDKSTDGEIQFIRDQERCEAIWKKLNGQADIDKLSPEERKFLENCSETIENYWNILGVGCSWYCGGGTDTNSASSELRPLRGIKYSAKNIHDLNYKTAWVEGVPGYGIGESVVYHFPPTGPRITKIIVVNGYVKSKGSWEQNSRVKKLKMYIDDKPAAILNLADSRQEQTFKFDPIGVADRQDCKKLEKMPSWTIRFEILDVYKGTKYDDTAITEIYFDGIDVH